MLQEEDRKYVVEKLTKHVASLEKPRETLVAPFIGTTLADYLDPGPPRDMVLNVVRLCIADAWTHDPPWLVLLFLVLPVDVMDAKLAEIRDRVRRPPPAGPDKLDASVLDNGTPFVNRKVLRGHLRRLATSAADLQPILVVSGEAKSGKSYSAEYIDHFSVHQPPPTLTSRVPLRSGSELETGPEEVAIELVRSLGRTLKDKPSATTNQKLFGQQLASWVLHEAIQTAKQCWLVLDNFQRSKLRPDTCDFVVALADTITTGVFRERCRLILIGFDRSVLAVNPGRIAEERILELSQAEIAACVSEIARRAPVPLDPGPLVAFASDALPDGEQRLSEMNARLRALLLIVDQVREIHAALPDVDFETVVAAMLADLPRGDSLIPEVEKRLEALRGVVP